MRSKGIYLDLLLVTLDLKIIIILESTVSGSEIVTSWSLKIELW